MEAQVAIVGAGPVGMTLAGRLAQHGIVTILLEQNDRLSGEGSKAICMQRETLEIWARLGIGARVAKRGIQWQTARTFSAIARSSASSCPAARRTTSLRS